MGSMVVQSLNELCCWEWVERSVCGGIRVYEARGTRMWRLSSQCVVQEGGSKRAELVIYYLAINAVL